MCVIVSDFCLAQAIHVIASYLIFSAVSGSFFFPPPVLDTFYVSRVDTGGLSFGRRLISTVVFLFFIILFFLSEMYLSISYILYGELLDEYLWLAFSKAGLMV